MKKHLLFALVLFLTLPVTAQVKPKHVSSHPHQSTTLTVTAPRGINFWIYVNDVLQIEQPTRSICIRNLVDDSYYVRVELDNQLQNCVGQYVDLKQPQTLTVVKKGNLYGLETTDAHIRPEVTMDLLTQQPYEHDTPVLPPPPGPYSHGMNPRDYEDACQMISNESFDNTKLTLAKQIVSANPMSASQITNICKLFSFESNKLDFAKYAYRFCVDANKYYLVNEAFAYDSSKRELDEYIKGL
jgi:hypothetical protein